MDPAKVDFERYGSLDSKEDGWSQKALREVDLLCQGATGFGKAASEAFEPQNLLKTTAEVAMSAGVGALMARYAPGKGLLGTMVRTEAAILSLSFARDVAMKGSEISAAAIDNWHSDKNWQANSEVMQNSAGRFLFDSALMTTGALAGSAAAHHYFAPKRFPGPGLIEPLTKTNLGAGCDATNAGFFYGKEYFNPSADFRASLNPALYERLYSQHPNPPRDLNYWLLKEPGTGKVVGSTGLYRYPSDGQEAVWLGWTSVLPEHQGKGYGKQLVDFAIAEARAGKNRYLRLYTSDLPAESRAQGLYESRGLKITKIDPPDSRDIRVIYRELDLKAPTGQKLISDKIASRPIFDKDGKPYAFSREPVTSKGWRAIYESEFPDTERQPYDFLEGLEKPDANPRVQVHVSERGNKTAAFSMASDYGEGPEGRQLLLAYIGVDPSLQSKGIGSQHLRSMLWELQQQHPDAKGMFAEIEDPFSPGLTADSPLQRRLRWYERNGAELLDRPHPLPFTDGTSGAAPGRLVWFDFNRGGVSSRGVDSFVFNLYKYGYELPADHPLMLQNQLGSEAAQLAH